MHSERDWVYYADRMPLTTIVPCYANGGRDRAREDMLAANLAKLINSAAALVSIIEENPALFFGMEDTCRSEFDDVAEALEALAPTPF